MKSGFFIFLSLFTVQLFAQSKIYTNIQANKKKYPTKDFYVEHVIDRRLNKENIGYIYKSSLTYKHPADFKKTLPEEFLSFYRSTYPNQTSLNRILVAVNQFEIKHTVTGKLLDTGTVMANFDFYMLRNDSAFFLYNFTSEINDVSDRITYSHPNRMKRIVLMSVAKLDSALLHTAPQFALNLGLLADSARTSSSSITKKELIKRDSIEKANDYPSDYFLLLGTHVNFSTDNIFAHFNADILFRFDKHPTWLLGASIEYQYYGLYLNPKLPYDIEYRFKNINIGCRVLKQLHRDVFLNIQTLGVFGKEMFQVNSINYALTNKGYVQIDSAVDAPTVYGVETSIGVYLLPARRQNFYTGLDLFFRVTTSKVIEDNGGIKINLGFKF